MLSCSIEHSSVMKHEAASESSHMETAMILQALRMSAPLSKVPDCEPRMKRMKLAKDEESPLTRHAFRYDAATPQCDNPLQSIDGSTRLASQTDVQMEFPLTALRRSIAQPNANNYIKNQRPNACLRIPHPSPQSEVMTHEIASPEREEMNHPLQRPGNSHLTLGAFDLLTVFEQRVLEAANILRLSNHSLASGDSTVSFTQERSGAFTDPLSTTRGNRSEHLFHRNLQFGQVCLPVTGSPPDDPPTKHEVLEKRCPLKKRSVTNWNQEKEQNTLTSAIVDDTTTEPRTPSNKKSHESPSASAVPRRKIQKLKLCRMESCQEPAAKRTPYCSYHSGPRKCEHPECNKCAQGRTRYCIAHGGGRRCKVPGCDKGARDRQFCAAHGGGRRCIVADCSKLAVSGCGRCTAHGGGKRCQAEKCTKSAQSNTSFCVRHGGGRKCKVSGCVKVARGRSDLCMSHGNNSSASQGKVDKGELVQNAEQ